MKLIEHDEFLTLIPHRGKMVLIDRVTDWDTAAWRVASETVVREGGIFYEPALGGLPNYVLLEFAAQTVAVLTGLVARERGIPANMGFILSVSALTLGGAAAQSVRAGATVAVSAEREGEAGAVHTFRAQILVDGAPAGGGKLTVMEVAPAA